MEHVNFSFNETSLLWSRNIQFEIVGPQRWSLTGDNGSGKTTLLNLILGKLSPSIGKISLETNKVAFIDQQLSILNNNQNIYEQVSRFNTTNLSEGDLRIRLARFLFYGNEVYKKVGILSGGEKMRVALACILATNNKPHLLILDEPTNNLDLNSINEVVNALSSYKGALLVVSHDPIFLKEIQISHQLKLE